MRRKWRFYLLWMALTFLCVLQPQQTMGATDAERITNLENQIADLQSQQKQLAEQNRRLLELMQQMAGGVAESQALATKPKSAATLSTLADTPLMKTLEDEVSRHTTQKQPYAPGWLARIISVPKDFNIIDPLPPLEVVNFVATKSGYQLYEYLKLVEGAFPVERLLWKAEAFLKAEQTGNYVFSISSSGGKNISKAVYIEGVQVAAGQDDTLLGASALDPGLYKIELRVCDTNNYYIEGPDFKFNLQVKRPSDSQMLPISQVLLLPVPNNGKK